MLIRSQNKAVLLNFSNWVAIYTVKDGDDFIVSSLEGENKCTLGKYSTKAKALKVLDMIQDAYADYKTTECACMGIISASYVRNYASEEEINKILTSSKESTEILKKAHIFQMPADSEVEV